MKVVRRMAMKNCLNGWEQLHVSQAPLPSLTCSLAHLSRWFDKRGIECASFSFIRHNFSNLIKNEQLMLTLWMIGHEKFLTLTNHYVASPSFSPPLVVQRRHRDISFFGRSALTLILHTPNQCHCVHFQETWVLETSRLRYENVTCGKFWLRQDREASSNSATSSDVLDFDNIISTICDADGNDGVASAANAKMYRISIVSTIRKGTRGNDCEDARVNVMSNRNWWMTWWEKRV